MMAAFMYHYILNIQYRCSPVMVQSYTAIVIGKETIDDNGYRYIITPQYLHILDHTGSQVNVIGGFNNPFEVALY